MKLYYVMSIVDRNKGDEMLSLYNKLNFSLILANLGKGTATTEHLLLHDLQKTEKVVLTTIATVDSVKKLFTLAKQKMFIDIPGNGIMLSIPVKSVGGGNSLAFLTKNQELGGGVPKMEFKYELITVVITEGQSDAVMDVAREAGAGGGTVIHAKGTGSKQTEKFMGISIAQGKDLVYILSSTETKNAIMKNIAQKCGKDHPAHAVCFSVPVSAVSGIRMITDETEE